MTSILIDGLPPTEEDLRYQALVNYGAYTSFRVEAGGVRGLDRHLARLSSNSDELFGQAPEHERLRSLMRAALGDTRDAWLRISVFSPEIWARQPSGRAQPKVMTMVSPPPPPLAQSVRVQVQTYGRDAAHIKHTATFPLIRARRLARDAGFDDALFADADGVVSEGSLWNIGFLKGDTVIWPQAPMLPGVAQGLIQTGLDGVDMDQRHQPVRVSDLGGFDGAFLCNSATPACAITAIDAVEFEADPDRLERIARAWASAPLEPI